MLLKKELLIIGGGFAGFWSAISAIRQSREIKMQGRVNVTVINPDNLVTVLPTKNDLSLEGLSFFLDRYLSPLGINQISGRVTAILPNENRVKVGEGEDESSLTYDYLILASGASLSLPKLAGIDSSFRVDSIANILKLESHFIGLAQDNFLEKGALTIVVVGSESMGLETAVHIEKIARSSQFHFSKTTNPFTIILLEEEGIIAPNVSNACRDYIEAVIQSKNIEIMLHKNVASLSSDYLCLTDGKVIPTKTVIWTKGLQASRLTRFFEGMKDPLNRIKVDSFLKLDEYDNVIAAGNVANSNVAQTDDFLMDSQYAHFEGRWAGHNAINDLFNLPLKPYAKVERMSCIDLGPPVNSPTGKPVSETLFNLYDKLSIDKFLNTTMMFPWQDIEATVKASYPEFTVKN